MFVPIVVITEITVVGIVVVIVTSEGISVAEAKLDTESRQTSVKSRISGACFIEVT